MKYRKKFIKILKENIKLLMVLIQEQKNLMKNQKDNLSDNLVFGGDRINDAYVLARYEKEKNSSF